MKKMIAMIISILFTSLLQAPPNNSVMVFVSEGVNPFIKVWDASGITESGKDPFAYNKHDQKGGSFGIVQIGQSMLNAFNADNGTHYILNDCFGVSVSRKVFMWHFQKQYPDIEAACRSWNGGGNWKQKKSTLQYWKKIQKELNN